ncbi:ATP-binding cassette domain-containing protein [Mycoplasma struthionis]|uniref:ATP-binding cassette domain-containing protein n=1 Tax=Mycoplasma struthionis TaxID=538220 RepID=UPI002FE07CFE
MKFYKKNGKTILFISHKLKEIEQVADNATVLRLGKVAGNFEVKKTPMSEIVKAMVGDEIVEIKNTEPAKRDDVVFSLKNVTTTKLTKNLKNISFDVHAGEIFAVAGVAGNGQEELEYVCGGLEFPHKGTVELRVYNPDTKSFELKDITKNTAYSRSKDHMAYIPADRHHHGLILDFTLEKNSIIRRLWDKTFEKGGFIKNKEINKFTNEIIQKYDVRSSQGAKSLTRSLSGGNQQKFIVGREMEFEHDFIIIVQPTRGMDIGAITNIHSEIIAEKQRGKAILLISYELDEVLALADTIAVINEGKIISIQDAKKITRDEIGKYMSSSNNEEENNKWWIAKTMEDANDNYRTFLTKKYSRLLDEANLKIASLKSNLFIAKKGKNVEKAVISEIYENIALAKKEKQDLLVQKNEELNILKDKSLFESLYNEKMKGDK